MYLRDQFESYLRSERQYSPHTCRAYLDDLDALDAFRRESGLPSVFEPAGAAAARHPELRRWLAQLVREGLAARSLARKRASMQAYFAFAVREGVCAANPATRLRTPRIEKKLPAYLREAEAEQMLDPTSFAPDFTGQRDRCLLELLYGCGLRRAELISLRHDSVDRYGQTLRVAGKGGKARVLPFGRHVREALDSYLDAAAAAGIPLAGPLLVRPGGEPLYPKLVHRIVQQYAPAAPAHPHALRHSYATHLLDRGADLNAIKELLGHSSLAATEVYTHNTISKLKAIHALAHPRAEDLTADPL
jgi:integrase/recombinase XerC